MADDSRLNGRAERPYRLSPALASRRVPVLFLCGDIALLCIVEAVFVEILWVLIFVLAKGVNAYSFIVWFNVN